VTFTLGMYLNIEGVEPEKAKSIQALIAERPDLIDLVLNSVAELKEKSNAVAECMANDQLLASLAEHKESQPQTVKQFMEENGIDPTDHTPDEIDEAIVQCRAHQFDITLGALPNRLGRIEELSIFDLRFLYAARIGRD
jgi:hypothetical protein